MTPDEQATVEAGRDLYRCRHGHVKAKAKPAIVPADTDLPGDRGAGNLAEGAALYQRTQRTGSPTFDRDRG